MMGRRGKEARRRYIGRRVARITYCSFEQRVPCVCNYLKELLHAVVILSKSPMTACLKVVILCPASGAEIVSKS